MKDLITIMLNGAFDNIKRILFASDRVTDMEMRNAILNGEVKPTRKVNEELCIGCSGCANICPTGSITMKPLQKPVKITENWVKKEVPEFNEERCVVCYWCHDFCPIYALYGQAGAVHPNDVGESDLDPKDLMSEPIKIDEEKLAFISQYLATNSVITKHEISNVDNDADVVDEDSAVEDSIASVDADSALEDSIASVDADSAVEDSAKENGDD